MPIPSGPFPHKKRHLLPGMIAVRDDGRCFFIVTYRPATDDFPAHVLSATMDVATFGDEAPIASIWTGEGNPNQRTMMWRRDVSPEVKADEERRRQRAIDVARAFDPDAPKATR